MKNNTIYFISNKTLKYHTILNVEALDDRGLLLMSDLVILDNIIVKDRHGSAGKYVADADIFSEFQSFDGIAISRPTNVRKTKSDSLASEEYIVSIVKSYLNIQSNQLDPIIDKVALELRGLYPNIPKNQLVDWALEFINCDGACDGECDKVFGRLNDLFSNVP